MMKRDDAVKEIRSIERRCRGPHREKILPRDYERFSKGLQDSLAAVTTEPAGGPGTPRELITRMVQDPAHHASARELDETMRSACGYDVNEIIAAGPLDGTKFSVECPQCKQTITGRHPFFELDDDAAAAAPQAE